MTRIPDTYLEPKLTKCNIRELHTQLRMLTAQVIAAIHVQTGVQYPTVKIFTVPQGLPMDVKSRFPIPVEQGYTVVRGYFSPLHKVPIITTDQKFNFNQYQEQVLNLLTAAFHEVKDIENNINTMRLHLVGDLNITFVKIDNQWIRRDNNNVRVLDYMTEQQEAIYGFRYVNGRFTEFVKFELNTKNIADMLKDELWTLVATAPPQTEFIDGSKVEVDTQGLKVILTMSDNTVRVLTVTKNGTINWTENVEYGIIGRYFMNNGYGLVTRYKDGFAVIPPELAQNLPMVTPYLKPVNVTNQLIMDNDRPTTNLT